MANTTMQRSQQDPKDLWAIEDLYATDEAWEADLGKLRELTGRIPAYAGQLGKSAQTLLSYLKLDEEMSLLLDALANYAQRRCDEDTRVSRYQAMTDRITAAWVEAASASSFATPELLAIPDDTLEAFLAEQPELEVYRRYFFNLRRRRAHILTPAEEKLLAGAGEMAQGPDNIYSMFADADVRFADAVDSRGEAHPLTQGTYVSYLERPDRTLRQSAFTNYYVPFDRFRNTLAATLSAQVKQLQFFAAARKYASPLEASLDHSHVPVAVYHNLIDAVRRNLPLMHRYVRLRKRLLGLPELHMYDVYAPLVPDVGRKIPFEEAKETVYEALAPMGEAYRAILREGYENRWIDVYEDEGKRSGAYSAGARVHPYVLLNYTGTLDSQFTLAHEMGHAIHSYLSNREQPPVYSDYVIFVAEVASTCNEALLMEHLLGKTTDRKERAYLINHFLDQFKGTLYRQTMFAEFELRMGELNAAGTALTADTLCQEYRKLNEAYFGPDMVLDPQIELEWARIPHFYYNYYVFQYATGYAAAIALSRRILREGSAAVQDYLGFLSGGCSQDPVDLLRGAGVDMTTAQPVEQALQLFGELLDEMEQLMAE